jgi:Plasmid pRiA4b ORF-3-like protein
MPEPPSRSLPTAFQLRVVPRGISPLIWRGLLVRSDSTIADFHRTLQVAFGWSDEHLHRFGIHGRLYGTDSRFDSRRVQLADLGLRLRVYKYDLIDGWQHDVRLEQILPLDSRYYPLCIGGRRPAPAEDCGGAWAFLELRQRYSPVSIANRTLELKSPLLADCHADGDDDDDHLDDATSPGTSPSTACRSCSSGAGRVWVATSAVIPACA